jgi:putative FmdB family regulatory protein
MPVYEYFCQRCTSSFMEAMHVSEHEKELPKCPECHKKDKVQTQLSTFHAVTSRKSASY